MQHYHYRLEFKVRDYECDLQGIVNNSVYQNYLEHARHEFLLSVGLDFAALFQQGIAAAVARADLRYKTPLRSGDRFEVCLRVEVQGLKYIFYQDIYRLSDGKMCLQATITTTSLVKGRLAVAPEITSALEKLPVL